MRQGRHSRRTAADWDTQPSRSAERSAAVLAEEKDPEGRAPGRKDKKNHCKPARGPHVLVMVLRSFTPKPVSCQWSIDWDCRTRGWVPKWRCWHREECGACGKVFKVILDAADCPDWHPARPDEERALGEEIARRRQAAQRWSPRKRPVTGPQGYRRTAS